MGGVAGHYVRASEENPQEHAIALVCGRLYVYALVNNVPDAMVCGSLGVLRLANVDIGQKHHSRVAVSEFGGIAAQLCVNAIAA